MKLTDKDIINLDGTLFLKQTNRAQEQFSYLSGEKVISEDAIISFNKNVAHNVDYCNSKKIPYLHIIFPAKIVAFKDEFFKLNIDIKPICSNVHLEDNHVFYPIKLLKGKEHYLKTDTHINEKGNIIIFEYLLDYFKIKKPNYQFIKKEKQGDLGKMLDLPAENVECLKSYNNTIPHVKHYSLSTALKGNSGDFDYYLNSNFICEKRVVLFGDSFFKDSINIYSYFFKEVIYIRNPFILTDIANILSPDIILTGNAERYLITPPDIDCFRPFFSNFISNDFNTKNISRESNTAFNLLLLGRFNPRFQEWLLKKKMTIPKEKLSFDKINHITLDDVNTDRDVDFCRDMAVRYEYYNMDLAIHLMTIANKKRPDGDFIKQKLNSYQSIKENL